MFARRASAVRCRVVPLWLLVVDIHGLCKAVPSRVVGRPTGTRSAQWRMASVRVERGGVVAQRRRTRRRTGRVSQGERGGRVWAGPQETTGRCKIGDDTYDTHAIPDFAAYFVRHVVLCKASFVLLFSPTSHRLSLSVSLALARAPPSAGPTPAPSTPSHYAVYLFASPSPSSRSVSFVHSSLFFISFSAVSITPVRVVF